MGYTCIQSETMGLTHGDLYYLPSPPPDKPSVFFSGLLTPLSPLSQTGLPFSFPEIPDSAKVDIFAWSFYRLIQADRYQNPRKSATLYVQENPDAPSHVLIEDLAFNLAQKLKIPIPQQTFDYEITIDVDNPWKYRHKPIYVRWGGLLKDLFKVNLNGVKERWKAIIRKEDPFETDSLIKRWCPPEKTTIFYLVDGNHVNDSRFNLHMVPYQKRVLNMKKAGYRIGLHPSYESQLNEQLIQIQKSLLESVVGTISQSRQHYLRYTLPQTFQSLLRAGIRYEYSICPRDQTSALTAITRPYPWYDLSLEKETNLILVPAFVMDRSLQQNLNLKPDQAMEKIRKEIQRVRRAGGKFVIILHNETFSESGEWKGWRSVIQKMLEELKANGS